jgi:hypothetical protein
MTNPEPTANAHVAAHRRSDQRRRMVEKVLAAVLLFIAFAVTVVLLGLQWLGDQSALGPPPQPSPYAGLSAAAVPPSPPLGSNRKTGLSVPALATNSSGTGIWVPVEEVKSPQPGAAETVDSGAPAPTT